MEIPTWAWIVGLTAGPAALLALIRSIGEAVSSQFRNRPSMSEEEIEAYREKFAGIRKRTLPSVPLLSPPCPEWGPPTVVYLSADPEDVSGIYRESAICPVCGRLTEEGHRKPASLEPRFSNGAGLAIGVSVHAECLHACPETELPRGIPW